MADVFISYKREERPAVEHLAATLRGLNLSVWFDASMTAGESFSDEIDREARNAKAILVCWSPTARESRWVKAEALIGFEHDTLAAAYVAGPDGFSPPAPFNSIHAEDLRAWLNAPSEAHAGWRSLLRRIGKLSGRADIESWGALDQTSAAELRAWIGAHEASPLFMSVDALLRARETQDAERTNLERAARERRTREEAERRVREEEAERTRPRAEPSTQGAGDGSAPERPGGALNIALGVLTALTIGLNTATWNTVTSGLQAEYGFAFSDVSGLFSVSAWGGVLGGVIAGMLADARGRKPVLIACVAVLALSAVVGFIPTNFAILLAVRAITGACFGGAFAVVTIMAAESSRPERRISTAAFVASCVLLAVQTGTLVSILTNNFGWRATLALGGGVAMVVALALLLLRETNTRDAARIGFGSALFGDGRAATTVMLGLAVFAVLFTAGLASTAMQAIFRENEMAGSEPQSLNIAYGLAGFVGAFVVSRMANNGRFRWPLIIALLVLPFATFFISAVGLTRQMIGATLAGFCMYGAQYTLYAIATSFYPRAARGAGFGAAVAIGRLGAMAGPPLVYAVNASSAGAALIMLTLSALVSIVLVFLLGFRKPAPAD